MRRGSNGLEERGFETPVQLEKCRRERWATESLTLPQEPPLRCPWAKNLSVSWISISCKIIGWKMLRLKLLQCWGNTLLNEQQESGRLKVRLCLGIKQTLHLLQRAQNVDLGSAARCYPDSLPLCPSHTHTPTRTHPRTHTHTHTHTHTPLFFLPTGTNARIPQSGARVLYFPQLQGGQRSGSAPLEVVTMDSVL